MHREDMIRAEIAQDRLRIACEVLGEERDAKDALIRRNLELHEMCNATQKRCDEAHAALSYAFHALVEISLLTSLGGEVDGYEKVVQSVREVVEERDKLRNASILLD